MKFFNFFKKNLYFNFKIKYPNMILRVYLLLKYFYIIYSFLKFTSQHLMKEKKYQNIL